MRTVQDIYERYRIMPSLQLHQLRVAACAQQICESLTAAVAEETVIDACLFHDMGNIIKSDLGLFPDMVEPEGRAHWEMVKADFIERFGRDEHAATIAICHEIGLAQSSIAIIEQIGFSKMEETIRRPLEFQVGEYCDLRVGPHGVLTMQARIDEGTARYRDRHSEAPRAQESYESLVAAAYTLEQQVFAQASIAPADLTEDSARIHFDALRAREIV